MCDDERPDCRLRHIQPLNAEDLSIIVEQAEDGAWRALCSPPSVEQAPDYNEDPHFPTETDAQACLADSLADGATHD